MNGFDDQWIRVEIRTEMLQQLMASGQACAADFRCLDARSKESLWRMCLDSCRICRRFTKDKTCSCPACANIRCGIKQFLTDSCSATSSEEDEGAFTRSNTDT